MSTRITRRAARRALKRHTAVCPGGWVYNLWGCSGPCYHETTDSVIASSRALRQVSAQVLAR